MPRTSLTIATRSRQQIVRQARPVGGHAVEALDRADRHRVFVGAGVAHDADALHLAAARRNCAISRSYQPAFRIFGHDPVGQAQQSAAPS
jgi:hypothetical protein